MKENMDPISLFKQTNFSNTIWWKVKINISGYQNETENNLVTEIFKDRIFRLIYPSFYQSKKKLSRILVQFYEDGYICWINLQNLSIEKYDYKKKWLNDLVKQLKSLSKKNSNIILAGDFNIIPAAEDVYNVKSFEDDALYRLEIRKKFREMLNLGFSDVYRHFNESKEGYTFWDYMRGAWQKNNGMRIDHFLVSNSLIDKVKSININKDPRGREKPSDHTPIEINLA